MNEFFEKYATKRLDLLNLENAKRMFLSLIFTRSQTKSTASMCFNRVDSIVRRTETSFSNLIIIRGRRAAFAKSNIAAKKDVRGDDHAVALRFSPFI